MFKNTLKRLWADQAGSVHSAEVMLVMTMLCVGMLVGMKSLRDSTVTEFADMAQALANLNQSYSLPAAPPVGAAESSFDDEEDFCDQAADNDTATAGSKCVTVCITAYTLASGGEGAGQGPHP